MVKSQTSLYVGLYRQIAIMTCYPLGSISALFQLGLVHPVTWWFIAVSRVITLVISRLTLLIPHRIHQAGWWFQPTPLKNDGVSNSWDDDSP
jgi:hypothetical protein